jgi:uncharacterized protein
VSGPSNGAGSRGERASERAGEQFVATPVGLACITWYPAPGRPRAVSLLGHGLAAGVEAADLQALAEILPARGITVGLVTQPYRLAASRGDLAASRATTDQASQDLAWTAVWAAARTVSGTGVPVIAGGRSAGAQVACRGAVRLGACAVLALAYPLRGSGSPRELLATGRPTLVIQGGADPLGRPSQFPPLPPEIELVEIPAANHNFVGRGADASVAAMTHLTAAALEWTDRQVAGSPRDSAPR